MINRKWVGTMLVGGLLLGAMPAGAAEFRWPWEKPKDKKESTEKKTTTTRSTPAPVATPAATPNENARVEDRQMLPKLADFYAKQLDLADAAVKNAHDAQVKQFAQKLQRDSERSLGTINEHARSMGVPLKPHVRVSLADKLRQSGRTGGLNTTRGTTPVTGSAATDLEFLRTVMANIQEIRPELANYKSGTSDKGMHADLGRLFDDELVPTYEEAKALHDRIRNASR